jgi:hypothetical protein
MGGTNCPDAATSGFFNKMSFSWMTSVVKSARKGECDVHSLPLPTNQVGLGWWPPAGCGFTPNAYLGLQACRVP